MTSDWVTTGLSAVVILAAAAVHGIAGFGFAQVSMGIMPLFRSPERVDHLHGNGGGGQRPRLVERPGRVRLGEVDRSCRWARRRDAARHRRVQWVRRGTDARRHRGGSRVSGHRRRRDPATRCRHGLDRGEGLPTGEDNWRDGRAARGDSRRRRRRSRPADDRLRGLHVGERILDRQGDEGHVHCLSGRSCCTASGVSPTREP